MLNGTAHRIGEHPARIGALPKYGNECMMIAIDRGPEQSAFVKMEGERMKTKTCTGCRLDLALSEFNAAAKGKFGKQSQCRKCVRAYYLRNRDQAMARCRAWRSTPEGKAKEKYWRNEYRRNNRLRRLVQEARVRAKARGLPFDISSDDLSVPAACPVLGIPILVTNETRADSSPSLDRRDQSKGYVLGNVVVISWRANRLKSDASVAELRALLAYVERSP